MIRQNFRLKILVTALTFLLIIFLFLVFFVFDILRENQIISSNNEKIITCENLGCPIGTKYVGSKNSNVFHECDCSYAIAILPENRVCFNSTEEAQEKQYRPGTCVSH